MKPTTRKNDGQEGGRLSDQPEKGDSQWKAGGPGQQGHHGSSDREAGDPHGFEASQSELPEVIELTYQPTSHRVRDADKQQPEEAGPGRASKTPPARGRY
jgi:hypothetical protein